MGTAASGSARTVIQLGQGIKTGLDIAETRCRKCDAPMFIKTAPCFLKKRGWATSIKCIRCGHQEGYEKSK